VIPVGAESNAKNVNSDLDKGIESNLDAALIKNKLHDGVRYVVKNHVVTLTGEVDSQVASMPTLGCYAISPRISVLL
jgi:osmotically-inducible protein OsmY